MPIPTYEKFIEPILRYLATRRDGARAREVHETAASALGITESERQVLLPSGAQPIYRNRAGWAHDRLKRAGLSTSPRRGFWMLSPRGIALVHANPKALPVAEIERIATQYIDVPLRDPAGPADSGGVPRSAVPEAAETPDDRLEGALEEIRESVAAALIDALGEMSPGFFERSVLEVLHRMGYGASRSDLQRVGGSGDAGIDGIISLDRLGLEKVYVQAKRWQQPVGRPEIQGFYGALAGQRANKGVFITTSTFTAQASEFARSVERIVLVDGARLAQLMIDHEVGVSLRPVRIPRFDSDYFDEESG